MIVMVGNSGSVIDVPSSVLFFRIGYDLPRLIARQRPMSARSAASGCVEDIDVCPPDAEIA
jgi:hypothetical protein